MGKAMKRKKWSKQIFTQHGHWIQTIEIYGKKNDLLKILQQ